MKTPLILRYVIWSMLIFAVSMSIWSFRMLRPFETSLLGMFPPIRHGYRLSHLKQVDIPVRTITIYDQITQEQYLSIVEDALPRLRHAGARVVLVPLPEPVSYFPRSVKLLQRLAADSLVILGVPAFQNESGPWSMELRTENRKLWWVNSPTHNRIKSSFGVLSVRQQYFNPLIRFVPTGFHETNSGEPVPDVAVLALKRYVGSADKIPTDPPPYRLDVGPYTIRLARDGLSYLRFGFNPGITSELWATIDPNTDSLHYYPARNVRPDTAALRKAWQAHEGKIVMFDWVGSRNNQFPGFAWSYLQIFSAIFQKSFVSIHNEWNVLLITCLVLLLSVFSYTVRNGIMILVSGVLIVGTAILSTYLFGTYNIYFEALYIIVPIALCGFILPIVKTSGERQLAEATIKSLEEELRRLRDLLHARSSGPM